MEPINKPINPTGGAPRAHTPRPHNGPQRPGGNGPRRPFTGGGANRGGGMRREHGRIARPFDRMKKSAFVHNTKGGTSLAIPPVEEGVLRIIPIGGVEQVGQNMTALEYGNDIIIADCGFQFSTDDTPGVDYIIPNVKYLEERKDKIRGLFITHGHLDHTGAIPYVLEKLGNPPIYTRQFGAVMIAKRHEDFPLAPKLNLRIVEKNETIRISDNFVVDTFSISHTIPDSMGLIINTPLGTVALIEDVRVDNVDGVPTEEEVEQYKRFKGKDILMLTLDSTSIEKPGFSLSENTVVKNVEKIVRESPSRLIIAMFASQVERLSAIINMADTLGKKVVIEGRSMKTNTEISKQLGIIKAKNIIPMEDINNYPPNKIVLICTGAQGEEFSALDRISSKTHRFINLEPSDTILLSSSVIPGNEGPITKLKNKLYRSGAHIITYRDSDVHASGHGNREELKWIHDQINYRFFMPVHGEHYMLRQHADLAYSLGVPRENVVVPDNGSLVEIYDGGKKIRIRKEKAPSDLVTVDGLSIGDTQEFVLRDRKMLSEDGMFVFIALLDEKTGKLRKSADIISRGFVYLKENQELLREVRGIIRKTVEQYATNKPENFDKAKEVIGDQVAKFLLQKTGKRPLVIPVILSS